LALENFFSSKIDGYFVIHAFTEFCVRVTFEAEHTGGKRQRAGRAIARTE
jgi:hypothetical protein